MARPLILHNVPDEELYVGEDGVQRPFAMVFPQQDSSGRSRRAAHESGSFGKSTRRSRSKTGTPAKREDPTVTSADKIFSNWAASQAQTTTPATTPPDAAQREDGNGLPAAAQTRFVKVQEPTEVILRGYRSSQQQYAAINHYEQLAGRICEDYPREPPAESRRYKSDLRDPAFTQRRPLTPEERAKVNRADGGEHWVKVTFESAAAADNAIYASPQSILGYLVYAEPYRGIPPVRDEAIVDATPLSEQGAHPTRRRSTRSTVNTSGFTRNMINPESSHLPPAQPFPADTAAFTRNMLDPDGFDFNPARPQTHVSTEVDATGFSRKMLNPDEFDFNPVRRRVQTSSADAVSFSRDMPNPDEFDFNPSRRQGQTTTRTPAWEADAASSSRDILNPDGFGFNPTRQQAQTTNVDTSGLSRNMLNPDSFDFSPPRSQASTRTLDTGTVSSGTVIGTVTGDQPVGAFTTGTEVRLEPEPENQYCRAIPTVRKAKLLPSEQALLPAPSVTQRLANHFPMLKWFSGSMIGNEVPRADTGEFDWDRASLYWKLIFWLDFYFGLFGKEIVSADKDE